MQNHTMNLKALIIDDEMSGRTMIEYYTRLYLEGIISEIKAVSSIEEAKKTLETFKPDIVFADYELRGETGIDISKFLHESTLLVVVTAYSQYAINAIRVSVFDYILKPIEEGDFMRFKERLLIKISNSINSDIPLNDKFNTETIVIKDNGENVIIKVEDIMYVEASGAYAKIVTENRKYITSKTLKVVEALLPKSFVRIHRSYLVPLNKISSFNSQNVCLKNGVTISLSKTGKRILQGSL